MGSSIDKLALSKRYNDLIHVFTNGGIKEKGGRLHLNRHTKRIQLILSPGILSAVKAYCVFLIFFMMIDCLRFNDPLRQYFSLYQRWSKLVNIR